MNKGMNERLQQMLALHLDPQGGTPYWLERQQELDFDICSEVLGTEDLPKLGPFNLQAMRERPVEDFVPRSLLGSRRLLIGETGGATGVPKTTPWFEDEMHAAFVQPFLSCAGPHVDFGQGHWLWLGPSGPHIIGKAAREIALATTGCDGFSVDFDPRWYRSLTEGSLARRRYLAHLVTQAGQIVRQQNIRYLFSTPAALTALAAEMPVEKRRQILFVYLGGMPVEPETLAALGDVFPEAQFLSGYGNTLFGVSHEAAPHRPDGEVPVYIPPAPRLHIRVVTLDSELSHEARLAQDVAPGERGQVVMSRFDESCLLINVMERDSGIRVVDKASGVTAIGHPQTLQTPEFKVENGIY